MLGFQLSKIVDQSFTLVEYFTDPGVALENIDQLIHENIKVIFIIVDYQMPKMTGAQLIRSIKDKYPSLKCVMLSGQANQISVDELVSENMLESFIAKPWNEDELFNAIRPILENNN
jgi:DNA-binding NarL/FixJ family response regulator